MKNIMKNPGPCAARKLLAREVTIFIHGQNQNLNLPWLLRKNCSIRRAAVEDLSEKDLHAMEGIVKSTYALAELQQGVDVVRFLAETGILPSRGEARKMVLNGGISINRNKGGRYSVSYKCGIVTA